MPLDVWRVAPVLKALHLRSRGQDVWLVKATVEGFGVSNQVLASFRRDPHWEQLLMEWMARLRSGCVQYSSPVSYSSDVFLRFNDAVDEDFHDRAFLAVHGCHYTGVHAVFLEAGWHAFGGEDVFSVVDFVLTSFLLRLHGLLTRPMFCS